MGKFDHEVEVVMSPCLTFEQRVNAPAAVEPDIDAIGLQQVDDSQQALSVHRSTRLATAIGPLRHPRDSSDLPDGIIVA